MRPCAPVSDPTCLKAGPLTAACQSSATAAMSFGDWTTQLWHEWSFLDADNPDHGVQLHMEGSRVAKCSGGQLTRSASLHGWLQAADVFCRL
jgi:hypothetical protein